VPGAGASNSGVTVLLRRQGPAQSCTTALGRATIHSTTPSWNDVVGYDCSVHAPGHRYAVSTHKTALHRVADNTPQLEWRTLVAGRSPHCYVGLVRVVVELMDCALNPPTPRPLPESLNNLISSKSVRLLHPPSPHPLRDLQSAWCTVAD
jgi:hypothetical protein